jgi:hypothetical protein
MNKTLLKFIKYLEIETSINWAFSSLTVTQKFKDPVEGSIAINDLTVMLIIVSNGSNQYKKVKRLEVFYGNECNFTKALSLKSKINAAVPSIPICIINSIEGLLKFASF